MTDTSTNPDIKIIRPPGRWPGLGFGEMWQKRRVLLTLARRDFRARYSNKVLGVLWVLLEPLL